MTDREKRTKEPGIRFSETMSGYLGEGVDGFEEGERQGREQGTPFSFDVTIEIESVSDFIKLSGPEARMTGTVSSEALGGRLPIQGGLFTLFRPNAVTGKRQMTYSFSFTGKDDTDYSLYGYKVIYDDPGMDVWGDMTKLFTRIYRGKKTEGSLFSSGILRFKLFDLPSMLSSFEVTNTDSPLTEIRTLSAFARFCYGAAKESYLPGVAYDTRYENLVLRGRTVSNGNPHHNLFFFSGIHDRDFPWGDGEVFWDLALIIQKEDGSWERYVLTDRVIEGLKLDVEKGVYQYEGPIYQLVDGYAVSKSDLEKSPLPHYLRKRHVAIKILFQAEPYPPVDVPFPFPPKLEGLVPHQSMEAIKDLLRRMGSLGFHLTPHRVHVSEGQIVLKDESIEKTYVFLPDQTTGEAEISTFKNLRWPVLYYNYFCALDTVSNRIYVRVRSDVLRKHRTDYVMDRTEQFLGTLIRHVASLDLDIQNDHPEILSSEDALSFERDEDPLLEINNDHFPTATFQRRMVLLTDGRGKRFIALEEDMDPHRLKSIHSEKRVKVAAFKDPDKFRALGNVLEATRFFEKLDAARDNSGKRREDFAVVVKPNFMFMYSTKDPSTYTDPELVEYLIDRIHERGYTNLAVAEARSTYGTFFTNREVKTVAAFIGLTGKNYHMIDLSEDLEVVQYSGKLGRHYVNREWKNADFRISFAKNKTHVYAYYTLTIKNIYGALPMENKFLEYHHERDIFSTTIEYIKHFPIHFALIDAHVSADGPFGIFADKKPNKTETVIGSEDIVAADWVGAEKMGLDPMISAYMKQAVEAFGKPEIQLVGDRALYPNWVNVWEGFPPFLSGTLDRHYTFGNLFYSVFSYMDPTFQYKDPSLARRFLRNLADPMKDLFFQKINEGAFDPDLNRRLYELFTGPG